LEPLFVVVSLLRFLEQDIFAVMEDYYLLSSLGVFAGVDDSDGDKRQWHAAFRTPLASP
jgi:hypothetical protein